MAFLFYGNIVFWACRRPFFSLQNLVEEPFFGSSTKLGAAVGLQALATSFAIRKAVSSDNAGIPHANSTNQNPRNISANHHQAVNLKDNNKLSYNAKSRPRKLRHSGTLHSGTQDAIQKTRKHRP